MGFQRSVIIVAAQFWYVKAKQITPHGE